jgi:hypothetical protein
MPVKMARPGQRVAPHRVRERLLLACRLGHRLEGASLKAQEVVKLVA